MFNEQNAVENLIRDLLTGAYSGKTDALESRADYDGEAAVNCSEAGAE